MDRIVTATPEMYRQAAPTMNLFPINEKLCDVSGRTEVACRYLKPVDLFPQPAGFSTSFPKEEIPKIAADSRWARLLISYAFLTSIAKIPIFNVNNEMVLLNPNHLMKNNALEFKKPHQNMS